VKRKIWEEAEYAQKRIQIFVPPSGKIKLSKATKAVNGFIEEAFDQNGKYKDVRHQVNPSRDNCFFCPFNTKEFCDKGVS
jgi:hypothetical protein